MSRNSTQKKSIHSQHRVEPAISTQELEQRWNSLRLQAQTRDHLEHILQENGLSLALAATTALSMELKREEKEVTRSLWDWVGEELRLLFLEEGCQHIIESGRLIIDAILTWTFVQGRVLLTHLAFPLLALGMLLISCYLIRVRRQRHASGR